MPLSPLQALALGALVVALAGLLLAALHRAGVRSGHAHPGGLVIRTALALAAWLALTGALAAAGFFAVFETRPPRVFLAVLPALVVAALLARSRALGRLLPHVPAAQPIALQTFRLPLEAFLFWLFATGALPVQMTFEGLNYDVATGLLAPAVAWAFAWGRWPRRLGVAFNGLGLVLLFTVVTVAVLSFPGPLRTFSNEPSNAAVATFPMIWLPAFLVPLAFFGHLVSLRQLLGRQAPERV